MWKVYSKCPDCKREIEVKQKGVNLVDFIFEFHYNNYGAICTGSNKILVTNFSKAEHNENDNNNSDSRRS